MIDRTHPLPITRQAEALGMARSTAYALPRTISDRDLDLMKRIDRLHLEMPYAGSRMQRSCLQAKLCQKFYDKISCLLFLH